ncbi:MAG: transcription elongation factor GreA [Candidatus Kerfeldbacteria bacterium CG15_BIG_FIL_POST_REV_8_21_14_020_45_12]|uniref:Transcription elongation factor GreA n=1 Tax=Candidatus Kerfeldbacteria bacterium CG15_BIG_FIL_POST_REV_8_21_14_020_45_12 TaxID=2014247 RepID=A0A2M7H4N7_9BACT|nr:MAG: transcription elongation factor GreA [Candidatus Kerfeldbacteria bacterium CG15_BIG_FIL_POST_REV_8_21_14_020_45_12]PJA93030.1 MAG: transcription elongation factor GreA [Candidatus Kerfeldbacteria bacterium CG_4_9_14_3_um_filter_45_8]
MTDKKFYVTEEGLKQLELELKELKTVKRRELAERIQEAKELGDLSENAEYIEAKEEQGFVEAQILELEQRIKNCAIISHKNNTETVEVGSTITVKNSDSEEMTFTIVGSSESSPADKLISNESPLGRAFIGQNVGEEVTVETPGGQVKYRILSVE